MVLCRNLKKIGCVLAFGFAIATAVTAPAADAQDESALPVEDVIHAQSLRGGLREFSPNGKWLAYAVRTRQTVLREADAREAFVRTGLATDGIGADIAVVDIISHKCRNLTDGKGDSWLPMWSPNGRYLAFISLLNGRSQAELWVWDAGMDRLRRVFGGAIRMRAPEQIGWTPDSKGLVVATVPVSLSLVDHANRAIGSERRLEALSGAPTGSTLDLYERQALDRETGVIANSGPWGLDDYLVDLVLVDAASGKSTVIVHNKRIACFHVFRDGFQVAYSTRERFEEAGSQQVVFDVGVAGLWGGDERIIASEIRMASAGEFSVSPDESELAYRAYGPAQAGSDVYALDVHERSTRDLTKFANSQDEEPLSQESHWSNSSIPLWDRDSKFVYYIANGSLWEASVRESRSRKIAHIDGRAMRDFIALSDDQLWTTKGGKCAFVITHDDSQKEDGFYRIDLKSGMATKLLENDQCYTCEPGIRGHLAAFTNDGQWVAYTAEDAEHAEDIWLGDSSFQHPTRVTHLNPAFDEHEMGAARLIDWLDDDGQRRQGALILPSDYAAGKRSPLIVLVYGGTALSEKLEMFGGFEKGVPYLNVQLLATRGYAVLMPDSPQGLGTPMLDLAKTVLPGVNKAVELGVADPNRIGVLGHSYGGYTALSLIVQTRRFKAAVECDGYGDLIGHYGEMAADGTNFGTSIAETGQGLMGGTPWQFRDRYIENSPIFYADRVETPLLIVQGAEDTVVAPFLGDEVFVGLRRLGKVVEYAKYRGEGHTIAGYANQIDVAHRIIAWFNRYLKS